MKVWWPHVEALYGTLLAHHLTGEPWCLEWYQKVADWTWAHFPSAGVRGVAPASQSGGQTHDRDCCASGEGSISFASWDHSDIATAGEDASGPGRNFSVGSSTWIGEDRMNSRTITGRNTSTGQPLRITVEQGRIQAIEPGPADETAWLSHGFIDLQINGYSGCDFNGELDDPDIVIALAHKVIATGTTTFIPTIITASEEKIVRALGDHRAGSHGQPAGGLHHALCAYLKARLSPPRTARLERTTASTFARRAWMNLRAGRRPAATWWGW